MSKKQLVDIEWRNKAKTMNFTDLIFLYERKLKKKKNVAENYDFYIMTCL